MSPTVTFTTPDFAASTSAADVLSGLYVTDTEFSGCDVGTDFEDDAVNLVRYLRCSFNNCHSCGLSEKADKCRLAPLVPPGSNFAPMLAAELIYPGTLRSTAPSSTIRSGIR